jgi:NlpC/P60 family putative phage cell wall peptidase
MNVSSVGEAVQRAAVIEEARSWIGTKYHHAAGVKGAGVDCAQLLVRTYVDTGIVEPFETGPYCQDWHLHRSEERYLDFVLRYAHRVERPQPGDVFVLRYGRCYSHGGIVTKAEPLTVIHAFMSHRVVVEEELGRCPDLARRLPDAIFASFWGPK